jgi:hypothetical protein
MLVFGGMMVKIDKGSCPKRKIEVILFGYPSEPKFKY